MDETRRPEKERDPSAAEALAAWRELLGPGHVVEDGPRLELAERATFATAQRFLAVVEPKDRDEVAACLRVAVRYGVPLYPVSRGLNWGYGSSVAPQGGTVLLSLARLDRVVEFSEELAYVTVEPGVTFGRLAEFLRERGSRLLPPLTGTSPEASVVGNVLERGVGKGPYEEMAAHGCAYEVLLADGRVVRTGFAAFNGARAAAVRAEGPGPSLQGLFAQSNFGVVTRMTLWLEPAPEWRQRVFFLVRGPDDLPPVVDALRGRMLRGGPWLQVELLNDYRFVAQTSQFPFGEFDPGEPLPRARVALSMPAQSDARWIGCATLWAESLQELALRRDTLSAALAAANATPDCEEPTPGVDAAVEWGGLASAYWRKRQPMSAEPHPDRDRCGVIWIAPVLPMLGGAAAEAVELFERVMPAHGFEPALSMRFAGGRSIQMLAGILYDREEAGADERAAACQDALREALYERGLYPYRLGLRDMESPPPLEEPTAELLRELKRLFDPQGIIAPRRYIKG
jgi:4-cresol dehydrogenase (hydroxylating)